MEIVASSIAIIIAEMIAPIVNKDAKISQIQSGNASGKREV